MKKYIENQIKDNYCIVKEYCKHIKATVCFLVFILLISGCKKFVDVDSPATSTNVNVVYENDATAIATINNLYKKMSQEGINSGIGAISLYPSLSSDDLRLFDDVTDQEYIAFAKNTLTPIISGGSDYWTITYSSYLFTVNSILEGLDKSVNLTEKVKMQLMGEARFLRAFCYFYLVNLYGDVPLVLSTDYKVNSNIGRTSVLLLYDQIITDLKNAQQLLSPDYLNGTLLGVSSDRIAPNKDVATALLARVYLYTERWAEAETEATKVLVNTTLYDTVSVDQVFLINSKETLWQLQSISPSITNTTDAMLFVLPQTGLSTSQYKVFLNSELVNSFEVGDLRKLHWIDSVAVEQDIYHFPYKYKINIIEAPVTERTTVFRLAEQYLIRAEARIQLNKLPEGLDDLNCIRRRAGLEAFENANKEEILNQVYKERRHEFFTEWGHRWLDLKRTGLADEVLGAAKGSFWQATDKLYPIPQFDILKNNALEDSQNPGY